MEAVVDLRHFAVFFSLYLHFNTNMIYITRKATFNAAHKLARPDWTEAENQAVYGKCANPNWHGHNYTLFITVKGDINPETGFLVNLKWLKDITNTTIIDKVDHRNLNLDVDFMKGQLTSTENLAIAIWNEMKPHIEKAGAALHCVKLCETENNYIEYFGE